MYKELLEEQIKVSSKYTKANFGLQIGEKFPNLVNEITDSDEVCAILLADVCIAALTGKDLADSMKKVKPGSKLQQVILDNSQSFYGPLAMLYWGIEMGRKMERQEIETKKLEELFGQ